jgi:hypothetical protein
MIKLKKLGYLALVLAILTTPGTSFGQLGGLVNRAIQQPGITTSDFSQSLDATIEGLMEARLAFLDSQSKLMEALGLKTDAVVAMSASLRAREGASSNPGRDVAALKASSERSAATNEEIAAAMESSSGFSAEAREKFLEGSVLFVQGLLLEKQQLERVRALADQGKSLATAASPLEKIKVAGLVKPALELLQIVPGDLKEAYATFGKITAFGRRLSIDVPDADKAAASLGDL